MMKMDEAEVEDEDGDFNELNEEEYAMNLTVRKSWLHRQLAAVVTVVQSFKGVTQSFRGGNSVKH